MLRDMRQCGGNSHLPAERTVRVDTRMGTDGNALARCTWTESVIGDRFGGKSTTPDTMGTVSTHQSVAVVGPPRDRTPRQYEGEVVVTLVVDIM